MEDRLSASAAEQRFALLLFEAVGIVALALAAVGTYSLLSGNVADRMREIGVRAALGATRRSIVSLVLKQGLTLATLGVILGVAGALMSRRRSDHASLWDVRARRAPLISPWSRC
jgi:putative ABC transport system permease protein